MLCYYYPPLVDVGCKRSVAFSKYFKKHGWIPHVLSVKNPDRTFCSVGDDATPAGVHTEYSYSIINKIFKDNLPCRKTLQRKSAYLTY